jgi:hypothetical protein
MRYLKLFENFFGDETKEKILRFLKSGDFSLTIQLCNGQNIDFDQFIYEYAKTKNPDLLEDDYINIYVNISNDYIKSEYICIRPKIFCNDGFSLSVQGAYGSYSWPRKDKANHYSEMEIGYPSEKEPILTEYGEDQFEEDSDEYSDIYHYVPIEVINKVLLKHGGIDYEKTLGQK